MCQSEVDKSDGMGTTSLLSLADRDDATQRLGGGHDDVVICALNEPDRGA